MAAIHRDGGRAAAAASASTTADTALVVSVSLLFGITAAWVAWELSRTTDGIDQVYGQGPAEGPWGPHSAPIDWCETNYKRHALVAELWNTSSSALYVFVGVLGLLARGRTKVSPMHTQYQLALITTGIFSALFHATLWWWAQKLDEIAETVMVVTLLYAGPDSRLRSRVHGGLAAAGIVCIPFAFAELHLVGVVSLVVRDVVRHLQRARGDAKCAEAHAALQAHAVRGCYAGLVGFAAWLGDKVACVHVEPLQLHSVWHVGTALAMHYAGRAACSRYRLRVATGLRV